MVKFQSKLFPDLVLTDEHYQLMRPRLRYIESFRDEMEKMELWLADHPQKRPKKNWRTFITNWMKNANRYADEHIHKQPRFSKEAKAYIDPLVKSLAMSPVARDPNEHYRCAKCNAIHHPGARCSI